MNELLQYELYMGQVTKLRQSYYLVLLSIDKLIAKPGNKTATVSWPDLYQYKSSVRHNSRPIVSDGLLWLTDK